MNPFCFDESSHYNHPFEIDDDDSLVDQDEFEINPLDDIISRKLSISFHHPSMHNPMPFDQELASTSYLTAPKCISIGHPYDTFDKENPFYLPSYTKTQPCVSSLSPPFIHHPHTNNHHQIHQKFLNPILENPTNPQPIQHKIAILRASIHTWEPL